MFFSHENRQQKRRYEEMVLHEQIWKKLAGCRNQHKINIELVYSFFRIILDPARIPSADVAAILQQYIDKYQEDQTDEMVIHDLENKSKEPDNLRIWTGEELVSNFRAFNKSRLAYTKIGYMKPKKIEEYKEKQYCSFRPSTNLTSHNLDQALNKSYQQ